VSADPDDRATSDRFVRGLTLGALLGAVVAGSSIWARLMARRRPVDTASRRERDGEGPGAGRQADR
jgi:hypothetical protein